MDRQQAGDLLDDDLPGQLDGPAAAVAALPLGLEPPGFLTERQTKAGGGGGGRRVGRPEGAKNHRIKSGRGGKGVALSRRAWLMTNTSHTPCGR